MACKHTYYEILELYPSELNARIPLIQILRVIAYYPILFFANILSIISFKRSIKQFFTKKEETKGREFTPAMGVQPEDLSSIGREQVDNTISNYLSKTESESKINELINAGYTIDLNNLNTPFWIKERIEKISDCSEDKVFIVKNYPKFIKTLKKFIKDF